MPFATRLLSLAALAAGVLSSPADARGADCNENGIDDALDLSPRRPGFAAAREHEVPRLPAAVLAADLNGDGYLDLVAAGRLDEPGKGGISLLFNKGGGAVEDAVILSAGRNPSSLAAGDFDGDGDVDLAASDAETSTVAVLAGDGSGRFEPPVLRPVGARPAAIEAKDIDDDGDLDLATADSSGRSVSLLWNGGRGDFEVEPVPVFLQAWSLALADLDGDGDIDIAVAGAESEGSRGKVRIIARSPQGAFLPGADIEGDSSPGSVAAADLDGDGAIDLIVPQPGTGSQGSGSVLIFWNQGAGAFAGPAPLAAGANPFVALPVDLDGDRLLDLALVNAGLEADFGSLSVLRNLGGRVFSAAVSHAAGGRPHSLAAGDLDGDGDPDLAVAALAGPGSVITFLNDGGSIAAPQLFASRAGILSLALGDFDADGSPDAATSGADPRTGAGAVLVHRNDGHGRFEEALSFPAGELPAALALADLNSDGFLDAAATDVALNQVLILESTGDQLVVKERLKSDAWPASIVAADFDADGDLDLAVAGSGDLDASCRCHRGGGTLALFPNRGDASFSAPETRPVACCPVSVHVGDLDGDGDLDLVTANGGADDGATISIFPNDGRGRLGPEEVHGVGGRALRVTGADVDGDLDLDLAVTIEGAAVHLLVNGGRGTFEGIRLAEGGDDAILADLDGDSDRDLALARGGRVHVLRNNGGVDLRDPVELALGNDVGLLAAADLDGDGFVDLVAANRGWFDPFGCSCHREGALNVLLNRPAPAASLDVDRDGVPDECEAGFERGDVDGNGAIDLTDPFFTLEFLFLSRPAPGCLEAADADNDGAVVLTDPILLLGHLFQGGPPPAPPGGCGPDPDPPGSGGDLGCESYPPCGM